MRHIQQREKITSQITNGMPKRLITFDVITNEWMIDVDGNNNFTK